MIKEDWEICDYYLSDKNAYKRLKEEYDKQDKLVIAVDFDNTIYSHNPNESCEDMIELLKMWNDDAEIIIWTSRREDEYDIIRDEVDRLGIEISGINTESHLGTYGRKICANIFLDDRAGLAESYMLLYKLWYDCHCEYIRNKEISGS